MLPICWLTQTQFRRILYRHSVIISNINLIGRVFAQANYCNRSSIIFACIYCANMDVYTPTMLNCARVLFSRLCCVGMDIRHFLFMCVQQVSGWCKKKRMYECVLCIWLQQNRCTRIRAEFTNMGFRTIIYPTYGRVHDFWTSINT